MSRYTILNLLCGVVVFLFGSVLETHAQTTLACTGSAINASAFSVQFDVDANTCVISNSTTSAIGGDGDITLSASTSGSADTNPIIGIGNGTTTGALAGFTGTSDTGGFQTCSLPHNSTNFLSSNICYGRGLNAAGSYTISLGGIDNNGNQSSLEISITIGSPTAFTVVSATTSYTPAAAATSNSSANNQPATNRSAGAVFSQTSNSAQTFVTQTQTQNRLLGNLGGTDGSEQAGFTENGTAPSASASRLAAAYGETIKRPDDKLAWHSKDILNQYRKKKLAAQREKEQRANDGLHKLGMDAVDVAEQPDAFKTRWDIWAAGGYTKVDSTRTGNSFEGDMLFGRTGVDYLVTKSFLVGGFDKGDAEFESFNIKVDSKAKIAGGYFGYTLTRAQTGLPVDLILDGQGSYAWVDYDTRDRGAGTQGSFDATRFSGSLNLTAVIMKEVGSIGDVRILPKVGLTYANELQDAYRDTGGNAIDSQRITLGQFTFGSSMFVPVTQGVEVFGRAEGQWDFNDVGLITTSTGGTYKPDEFGLVLGGGVRAEIDENTSFKLEGASEGIGRENYDQYTLEGRIDFKF